MRNRDFNATALIELIDSLTRDPRVALEVLYLDCAPDELIRRYSETRRRHPLAPAETPAEGIEREIDLLAPIRVRADHLIDTTDMSPHDLKAEIAAAGSTPARRRGWRSRCSRSATSAGVPRGVDMIFDCRFLANPHWQPALRALDGRDPAVAAYVRSRPALCRILPEVAAICCCFCFRPIWTRARRIWPSALAVPEGNTGLLQLRKSWAMRLQKPAGRCQNVTGNWNAGRRRRSRTQRR